MMTTASPTEMLDYATGRMRYASFAHLLPNEPIVIIYNDKKTAEHFWSRKDQLIDAIMEYSHDFDISKIEFVPYDPSGNYHELKNNTKQIYLDPGLHDFILIEFVNKMNTVW